MAELTFFTGTMDSGKSTLALQVDHNHSRRGRVGLLLVRHDRSGSAVLTSRLGLRAPALEVDAAIDLWDLTAGRVAAGVPLSYLVVDEAQFLGVEQVDTLARVVDELDVDVFAFGLLTDFRTRLFPGSARLVELADRVQTLQVETLCWCGRRATHNARTVGGVMVLDGAQVLVGDVEHSAAGEVGYEVLCRRHHRSRTTAATA